jgi:hypothetical protein
MRIARNSLSQKHGSIDGANMHESARAALHRHNSRAKSKLYRASVCTMKYTTNTIPFFANTRARTHKCKNQTAGSFKERGQVRAAAAHEQTIPSTAHKNFSRIEKPLHEGEGMKNGAR